MEDNQMPTSGVNLTKKERQQQKRDEKLALREEQSKKRTRRRVTLWAIILVVLVAGGYGMYRLATSVKPSVGGTLVEAISAQDHWRGGANASVTLVEYSDFQCPACAAWRPVVQELVDDYGDKIKFVYRHFPLRNIHKNAQLAAQASEAAALQGKFWEMHDLLFENQSAWSGRPDPRELFAGYARKLQLNVDRFVDDIDSAASKERVERDYQSAQDGRIGSTPTFYLNGTQLVNLQGPNDLRAFLEKSLSAPAL